MSQTTTCPTCGAPIAPDQRYCLGCGTRVAAPRIDFLAETERAEAEARGSVAPAGAVAAAPASSRLDKVGGPMGVAAVVLVALGLGFLAGQAVDRPVPEQQPPVVNIENGTTGGEEAATNG